MDTSIFTEEQLAVKEAIEKMCAKFPNEYWREQDQIETYPTGFHAALAHSGWLGIALPEKLGGAGLGKLRPGPSKVSCVLNSGQNDFVF